MKYLRVEYCLVSGNNSSKVSLFEQELASLGITQPLTLSLTVTKITKTNRRNHMRYLIALSVALAFTAVSTGNLPKIINQVRKAQFQLIMESKASKWPKAMRLPSR